MKALIYNELQDVRGGWRDMVANNQYFYKLGDPNIGNNGLGRCSGTQPGSLGDIPNGIFVLSSYVFNNANGTYTFSDGILYTGNNQDPLYHDNSCGPLFGRACGTGAGCDGVTCEILGAGITDPRDGCFLYLWMT